MVINLCAKIFTPSVIPRPLPIRRGRGISPEVSVNATSGAQNDDNTTNEILHFAQHNYER